MKVALVHDYLKEFGGAERVLKILSEIYPDAPIYTSFRVKNSTAGREFKGKKIIESFLAPILKIGNFYSPLRFLAPWVWRSMDLSKYDLIITSCSWFISRGFKVGPKTKVVAYCHTPPRWLYGYETSVRLTKYWPVKIYASIVGHFIRMYDFTSAQKINYWIANSKNVQERIRKFYRKNSTVIYPPVNVDEIIKSTKNCMKENYFLIVSRLVGAKGLEEAAKAFRDQSEYKLKIVGEAHGYSDIEKSLRKLSGKNTELLGRIDDTKLYKLYGSARGFVALARDEDFGITPVEAQAAGTPVIAFDGGGFRESVIDGVTGILIKDTHENTIRDAVNRVNEIKWDRDKLINNAGNFSKERFIKNINKYLETYVFND